MQKTLLTVTLFLLVFFSASAFAQQTMTFDASTSFMLQEFEAIITEADGQLKVEMVMGQQSPNSNSLEDAIKRDDFILMMNGSRVSTIDDIRSTYESIAEGEEIKIGVRRGQERFILRKEKGKMPEYGGQRMVMTMDMELEEGVDPVIIPELGLMVVEKNNTIEIAQALEPLLPEELKSASVNGYTIKSVNEEEFDSAEVLKTYIEKLSVGDEIALTLTKAGDEIAFTFAKQKAKGTTSFTFEN